MRDLKSGGRVVRVVLLILFRTIDGLFEVFNLFNHENYGSYVTNESNARFGQPSFNAALAYQPRMMQLGFRVGF